MSRRIITVERRLTTFLRDTPACQAVADIPGVGLLTATAAVASIGEAKTFKSGREFAAWVGLVPRQRGDVYLRTLLSAVILRHRHVPWLDELLKRRPYNVVVAAVANKLARTIGAVLARGKPYNPDAFSAVAGNEVSLES